MDNVRPEGTEDQSVTSTSGKYLVRNVHVRRSERTRKSPQRYDPIFGAAGEWNNDAVANIVNIIQDGDINTNVDTNDILSLLAYWDAEYCMDTPSLFHMREYYVLKSQIHYPDTSTYMEYLSDENAEENFKAMDDKIQSLTRRDKWYFFKEFSC